MKMTKQEQYASYGINFDPKTGKIEVPFFGFVNLLLKVGNTKVGKSVFTWSTLPTNKVFHVLMNKETNDYMDIKGTCPCSCDGCYATTGRYNDPAVIRSLAINTVLIRLYPEFVKRALIAQIKIDGIKTVRIDAAGDIENEMIQVFHDVIEACNGTIFWTYTKNKAAENAFDDLSNMNIVKSIIPHVGKNYGHCDYIIEAYLRLTEMGIPVYICRCGIDKEQHCYNCKVCQTYKYVLFIEHSTEYKAEKDPLFPVLKEIIESQEKPE